MTIKTNGAQNNSPQNNYASRAHSHDELSLGLILHGSSFVSAEKLGFNLKEGDLIMIPAEMIHLCEPSDLSKFNFIMIYIDAAWWQENFACPASSLDPVHISCPEDMEKLLMELARISAEQRPLTRSQARIIESEFHRLLAHMLISGLSSLSTDVLSLNNAHEIDEFELLKKKNHRSYYKFIAIQKAIEDLEDRNISLDQLADIASMSKFGFIRAYTKAFGLTPHANILNLRIRKAILKLEAEDSLVDIALSCGFSDQSHFIKQFKLYTGHTPSEYRRAILYN